MSVVTAREWKAPQSDRVLRQTDTIPPIRIIAFGQAASGKSVVAGNQTHCRFLNSCTKNQSYFNDKPVDFIHASENTLVDTYIICLSTSTATCGK